MALEYPKWGDKRLRYGLPGLRWNRPLPSYLTDPPLITPDTKLMLTKVQARLISVCEKIANGLHTLMGVITLVYNPELAIRADIAALLDASDQVDGADAALLLAQQLCRARLDDGYNYLVNAARILRVPLGSKPSPLWHQAGWALHSLETPHTADLVLPHLAKLMAFLADHPEYETTTKDFQLTLVRCTAVHKALSDAMSGDSTITDPPNPARVKGVAWYETELAKKQATLLLTEQALKARLENFKIEFATVVKDPMSPHYITVGLPRPGDQQPPALVTHVRLSAQGHGQFLVEHEPVASSDHYIYRAQLVGTEAHYRYLGSNGQPNFLVKEQPAGATVSIQVVAVNEAGQHGPASAPVQITVT